MIGGVSETRMPSVRHATPDDAERLHAIAADTFALACPLSVAEDAIRDFVATVLSEEAFRGYLADPDRVLLLAEAGATSVGYAMVVFGEPTDPDAAASITLHPSAELSKLYVAAEHHGAGVGALLVDAAVSAARARSAAGLWLGVNMSNDRANRFYGKTGFAIVGEKRFLLGGRYEEDFVREMAL